MFYNFKDQILQSTGTGTEYRYRRYFFAKVVVPLSRYFESTECLPLIVCNIGLFVSSHQVLLTGPAARGYSRAVLPP